MVRITHGLVFITVSGSRFQYVLQYIQGKNDNCQIKIKKIRRNNTTKNNSTTKYNKTNHYSGLCVVRFEINSSASACEVEISSQFFLRRQM